MSWLNSPAAWSRESFLVLSLINFSAALTKTTLCSESGSRLATRLMGVPFGIIPVLMYPSRSVSARSGFSKGGTNSLRKCSEQSFCVRQMESLFSRFPGQSNFSTASLNASILPATEGSPVNFPSMLLCKNGAELQTLTRDGVRSYPGATSFSCGLNLIGCVSSNGLKNSSSSTGDSSLYVSEEKLSQTWPAFAFVANARAELVSIFVNSSFFLLRN